MKSQFLGWLYLDPQTGLERQPLFWICISIPILVALGLGIPVWSEYNLAFSNEAYSTFLEISKLPLGISSLSIPLAVLIGKLHGARQTAEQLLNTSKQIENTEQDNRTKLYLSHYGHFIDHFNKVIFFQASYGTPEEEHWTIQINRKRLYQHLYPDNTLISGIKNGDKQLVDDAQQACTDIMQNTLELIKLFENADNVSKVESLFAAIDGDIRTLEDHLCLQLGLSGCRHENQTWLQFVMALTKATLSVVSLAKSFDTSFESNEFGEDIGFHIVNVEFENKLNKLNTLDEVSFNDFIQSLELKGIDFTYNL